MCEKNAAQHASCLAAKENDELKQKITLLCKERDEAHRQINQLVIKLNDETAKVTRLEAENRAKEEYIAETIGKVIKERDAIMSAFLETVSDHCTICMHNGDEAFCERGCRFEWIGFQK